MSSKHFPSTSKPYLNRYKINPIASQFTNFQWKLKRDCVLANVIYGPNAQTAERAPSWLIECCFGSFSKWHWKNCDVLWNARVLARFYIIDDYFSNNIWRVEIIANGGPSVNSGLTGAFMTSYQSVILYQI